MTERRRHCGMTLVEMMIGLTAGLLLLGAVAYFFIGSRQVGRTSDDGSRMQESGRTALEILGRAIRQAGARSNPLLPFSGTALAATEGGSGVPDSISVSFEVQDPGAAGGGEANCLGNWINSGPITFVFAVDTTSHTLTCTDGSGAAPVVVMDNIDDMQITYGIDTNADGAIESYQTATGPPVLVPSQVAAVRVSLLVRGPSEKVATMSTQTYSYNGASVTATDGVLRQVYTSTFTLRNQAH